MTPDEKTAFLYFFLGMAAMFIISQTFIQPEVSCVTRISNIAHNCILTQDFNSSWCIQLGGM